MLAQHDGIRIDAGAIADDFSAGGVPTSSISTAKVELSRLRCWPCKSRSVKYAGPDQRVTATADILIDGTSPDELKRALAWGLGPTI